MGLKQYGLIVWRRAWIPALLLLIVAGVSLLTWQTPPTTYSTSMRFTVRVQPQTDITTEYKYAGYYEWLASEYMADDLTAIVNSQAFAADVNRHLAEMGSKVQIPPGNIGGVTFSEKQHRILRLNLTWGDAAELADIAEAVLRAMEADSAKYLNPLEVPAALVQAIDQPTTATANPPSLTAQLQLPVRLLLALGMGVALTFLLDYGDDRVRSKAEVEGLGIPVLGEVPRK